MEVAHGTVPCAGDHGEEGEAGEEMDVLHFFEGFVVGEEEQGYRLLNDMRSVTLNYNSELEAIGLCSQDDGRIKVARALLADAISSVDAKESFSVLNAFKDALNDKASNASINPMNYVNKIIVAYKNPGHNFAAPYISSIYAGMMLDRRC